MRPRKEDYEVVSAVPDGLTWKPGTGPRSEHKTTLFSMGNIYKLVRIRATGEVTYYKLKGSDVPATPKDKIDAEPVKGPQVRYNVGKHAWFIDDNHWYCVEVVERPPNRIVIKPVTGWDADRLTTWPYSALLEFPDKPENPLFRRLRPLKARTH